MYFSLFFLLFSFSSAAERSAEDRRFQFRSFVSPTKCYTAVGKQEENDDFIVLAALVKYICEDC